MFHGHLETADVFGFLPAFETFRGMEGLNDYSKKNGLSETAAKMMAETALIATPKWLPASASVYHTSSDPSDYILVPTIIMPSDLPNRNGTAFPLKELSRFDPEMGDFKYRGWVGKPIYYEHNNLDYTKSLGAVADVYMRPMPSKGNLWKVIALMAIDRTKRPDITNSIMSGNRRTYSMGAWVKKYQCSVCGAVGELRPVMKNKFEAMPCGTQHAAVDRYGKLRMFPAKKGGQEKTIGFLNALDIKPFEISTVSYPAFPSAYTPETEVREM